MGLEQDRSREDQERAGATPIDSDERDGLIPTHLQTQAELNQWESLNIAEAERWIARRRKFDPLSLGDLKELHRRMFGRTWTWAGTFRKSDKNISPYHWTRVPALVHDLLADVRAQDASVQHTADTLDDVATRFHHRLVAIHPWPNGNGRHARLATDVLLQMWKRPRFTWGSGDLLARGNSRSAYLAALHAADGHDFLPLRGFVRS